MKQFFGVVDSDHAGSPGFGATVDELECNVPVAFFGVQGEVM